MLEKFDICCGLFHGFDRSAWVTGTAQERLGLLPAAQEHILAQENGKDRCIQAVRDLSRAFALAVPHEDAIRIRDEVGFFQAVQAVLVEARGRHGAAGRGAGSGRPPNHLARGCAGGRDRHLRRRWPREARHLDPVGPVPRRGARHAAAQPRRRVAAEAAERRARHPSAEERGAGAVVRRNAGTDTCAATRTGPSKPHR